MAQPFDVEHFIVDLDEDAARDGARRLSDAGYHVTIFAPFEGHPLWSIQATRSTLVTPEAIAATRSELTQLAAELGGDYDGWGAPINT